MSTLSAFAFESIRIGQEPSPLTGSIYSSKDGNASVAFVTCEGNIRYRYDGGFPTANDGHLLCDGSNIVLKGEVQINNFKAINTTIYDAFIRVSYERP